LYKKTAAPWNENQKTTDRFFCVFCLFQFVRIRPTQQIVNLCMSPDLDINTLSRLPKYERFSGICR